MARLLNGSELQGFIKNRQLQQVRNLRQEHNIVPKLCIVVSDKATDVINTYIRMKSRYAEDIAIEVDVRQVSFANIGAEIERANADESVQGIILQLPIDDVSKTQDLCDMISPDKDVDGLGQNAKYVGATAQAIDWLFVGYNVELKNKQIVIVGNGKLVGGPLSDLWRSQGLILQVLD
ncbi:MAG: tetrahydrofolate dehydrogenase/cyclohydrolase catalytic domain-containing protein, partial [Candidatus Saccharimonas sp.]